MCFDHDSRPPIPPIDGGALDASDLVLDGGRRQPVHGLPARAPPSPTGPGSSILPDVRGLHAYYRDLALRFAEHGVDAIAIDYFGRTAGIGDRGPGFDYQPHVPQTTYEGLRADIEAAAAQLRVDDRGDAPVHRRVLHGRPDGVPERRVRARARRRHRLLRLADGDRAQRHAGPGGRRRHVRGPGARRCSGARTRASAGRCAAPSRPRSDGRGRPAQARSTYDKAPHSFFDRKADEFSVTSAKAWDEVLGFIRGGLRGADDELPASGCCGGEPAAPAAPPVDPTTLLDEENARDRELLRTTRAPRRRPDPAPAALRGPVVDAAGPGRRPAAPTTPKAEDGEG